MATNEDENKKIHELALKRFRQVEDKERSQRLLAIEDFKFAQTEDGQWDASAIAKRKDRPRYTINRVAGAIDQLEGDQRQTRTAIKVRPVSGGASEDVAKTLEGIIRNIEATSRAANAYDNAYDEIVNGGFGGWGISTEYADDSFDQDIFIKPGKGAASTLWFDTAAQEYDKRDANWCFKTVDMPREEREAKFKDHPVSEWPTETQSLRRNSAGCNIWQKDDSYVVAEYWIKTPIKKEIILLSDGRVIDAKEDGAALDELAEKGITEVKRRVADSHKIEMYLMDGGGILKGPMLWAGKYIPRVPVFGRQSHIEGKDYTRGIVRFAKDANRIYNYGTSTAIETTALTPKDPYFCTPAQVSGHESSYENFNVSNTPFMLYNPDPKAPGPPIRGGAPAVQGAILQQIQQASMDLYHVTGMQPPSFGANPELKSGKAIQAQEKQGDRGSFIFGDNLAKSQEYTAEILIDLIPRIMDTQRQVQIMHIDGETEMVTVNEEVKDRQTGETILVNDLSLGKYAVEAETGPAFATQRQESAAQIIELIASSPQFEALALDLVAKDLPILESKELTKRVRRVMIQQGVVDPTDEEVKEFGLDQPQPKDPQQEAITDNILIQTEKLISDIEAQDAKTLQTSVDTQNSTIKAYQDFIAALQKKIESGIPVNADDLNLMLKQQDIMEEAQQQMDAGPNKMQAASLMNQAIPQGQAAIQDGSEANRRPAVQQPSTSVGQDIMT